ncbi:MAG: energy-coupling factor transporter transmembrane protein EcfT [Candidatus Bathyarchaeota archaeon]|nr:energy-coupling factor transporter transmembrane protein EcfT [Candidatus Bathyarchaeota archaeon]
MVGNAIMSMFDGLRYKNVFSPIHRIDPRAKFIYVCVLFAISLLFSQLILLLAILLLQVPLVVLAKVKREWFRLLRGSALFALIIFIMNIVSLYFYGSNQPIEIIIEHALAMSVRFIVLVESFSIFFLTTSPDMLSLSMEQMGIPYEICFAFTTAIRFIPVLAEEAQTIIDSQRARGLYLEGGNFIKRVRNYIPILIPLIVNSIRRSLELAEAMESRAWGASRKRTNLYVLRMGRRDYLFILISAAMLASSIYVWLAVKIPPLTQIIQNLT